MLYILCIIIWIFFKQLMNRYVLVWHISITQNTLQYSLLKTFREKKIKFWKTWILPKKGLLIVHKRRLVKSENGHVWIESRLVGIDWSLLSFSHILIHILSHLLAWKFKVKIICMKYMVQPFVLEVLMSSFEIYPPWKITIPRVYLPPGGGMRPLLKQKLYIDWIFLFQSKILNFATIGFHPISLSTFIRNFALYCNVKKFKKFQ